MDTELRKRLEEAAKKYEPDAFDADYILPAREGFIVSGKRAAFRAGAEHGYKEAIAMAKEWLEVKVGNYLGLIHEAELTASTFKTAQLIADFEADMNKLWEEQK